LAATATEIRSVFILKKGSNINATAQWALADIAGITLVLHIV